MDSFPNLDAMDVDDLETWREQFSLLADYAASKRLAMQYRAAGQIQQAMQYEADCEAVYRKLDQGVKW